MLLALLVLSAEIAHAKHPPARLIRRMPQENVGLVIDDNSFGAVDGSGPEAGPVPAGIGFDSPVLGGEGCPSASASSALSPDSKVLTILFDQFQVESESRLTEKTCNLVIPVTVPAGYRVAVTKMDFRGYTSVAARAFARLQTAFHFSDADSQAGFGIRVKRQAIFVGPQDRNFAVSSLIAHTTPNGKRAFITWSDCGKDFLLNVDTQLSVNPGPSTQTALASLDSVDASVADGNVKLYFLWEACSAVVQPPGKPDKPVKPVRPNNLR